MTTSKSSFYILTFIIFFCLFNQVFPQSVRFFRERIDIIVNGENCYLEGTYYFANNGLRSVRHVLYYPFFINENIPFPDSMAVCNLVTGEKIKFHKSTEGIRFPIEINPNDTSVYKVIYQQKTPANKFRYILTTTKKWGKPFEIAEYSIKLLEKYEIKEFISHYKMLPEPREFEIIEKRGRPDYFVRDINSGECFGIELTSVYLTDRSVPDEHIKTIDQGILFEGIPFSREEIEAFKTRILKTIREKVKKAKSYYDLRYPLILSVYVNEYRSIFMDRKEWSHFISDNGNVFDFISPFVGVFFCSLANCEAVLVKPSEKV